MSVPFGKRQEQIGVVTSITQESDLKYPIKNLKKINNKINNIRLQPDLIKFISWVSKYTLYSEGMIMKMVLPNFNIINCDLKKIENIKNSYQKK